MEKIADAITETLDGRQPILIFEDLDKLNPQDERIVQIQIGAALHHMNFISLFCQSGCHIIEFGALTGAFKDRRTRSVLL